jgi:hypothetical protein
VEKRDKPAVPGGGKKPAVVKENKLCRFHISDAGCFYSAEECRYHHSKATLRH